jgi:hypothetical protein
VSRHHDGIIDAGSDASPSFRSWKTELGGAFNSAYTAQLGNVAYYVVSRDYGHPAYLEVRGPRGSLKRLDLGNYAKIEQGKQVCERHYAAVAT